MNKATINFLYKSFSGHELLFILRVELPDYRVGIFLTL